MSVSALILVVVLAIAGSALISLMTTANRTESMVAGQQALSDLVAQFTRDVRSANAISFPSGSPSTGLQLSVVQANGSTTTVSWTYSSASGTFTRGVGGIAAGLSVSRVDASSNPVLTYYDYGGTNISSTSASNIATCTTAIDLNLVVNPSTSGVAKFRETDAVALTNQLNSLEAQGNTTC